MRIAMRVLMMLAVVALVSPVLADIAPPENWKPPRPPPGVASFEKAPGLLAAVLAALAAAGAWLRGKLATRTGKLVAVLLVVGVLAVAYRLMRA